MSHASGRRRKRTLEGFVPSSSLKRLLVEFGGAKAAKAFAAGHSVVLSTHPAAVAARAAVKDNNNNSNNNNNNNNKLSNPINNSFAAPTASTTIVASPAAASLAGIGVQRDADHIGHSMSSSTNSNNNNNRTTSVITRLVTLDSTQRKALQITATKLKRSADATRDDVLKHKMYLEAGLAFLEHAAAHRDEKMQIHLLKTVGDFLNNLLSLAEGVRESLSANGRQTGSLDAIIILYLKLSCLTRFRRFGMNANKISRIRDSLSRQARQQQEAQHTRKQQQRHGHFGSGNAGGQKPNAVEDATRNSYVDYMVSEIKDPMAALQAYERSETLRARGLAMGAAAAGGKSSQLFRSMQAVPKLSSYAAPEMVEECVAQLRQALDTIKAVA